MVYVLYFVGADDTTPLNAKSPEPKAISVLSDDTPSSRSEKSPHRDEKTPTSSSSNHGVKNARASPLQNKQSLHKMLKSLANKV